MVDDCEAAALWTIKDALEEFGTARIVVKGLSAGAPVAAATCRICHQRCSSWTRETCCSMTASAWPKPAVRSCLAVTRYAPDRAFGSQQSERSSSPTRRRIVIKAPAASIVECHYQCLTRAT
ncbi:alpha/beta hydrolase fold domain-containing protein [Sphingomonas oligophenolica]|uniref:alpha/beta hydrolase fold domain-containing protein n=1 Tax=Sphingomonas oligophenolica TaxID=301154 RepID=UPI0019D54EB0